MRAKHISKKIRPAIPEYIEQIWKAIATLVLEGNSGEGRN